MKRALLVIAIFIAAAVAFLVFRGSTPPTEAERNRAFTESMSGVTLVGHSTRLSREGVFGPERYRIDGVNHIAGDKWLIRARMQRGGTEVPVPVPLNIMWAGDTPVMTLTDVPIPGFGTYTARIMLYRDQYAGTWSGGKEGGQMFGRIVR